MKLVFCLLLGCVFALRMTMSLHQHGYISSRSSQFPFIVCSIFLFPWLFVARFSDVAIWILSFVQYFGPTIFFVVIEHRRRSQFHKETSRFFDQLLLGVRSGNSIRELLRGISQDSVFGFHTREIAGAILREDDAITSLKSRELRDRAAEIQRVLVAGAKISDRIGALRRKYRMIESFRRKSRLATQPVNAQIIVIVVLYVALITLRAIEDPGIFGSAWFFLSLILVFAGIFAIQMMKRAFKWKI